MEKLTTQYIEQHAVNVQTYESFVRALIHGSLQHAKDNLPAGGTDKVTLDAKITIQPTSLLCIEVCIDTPFGRICKHVGV